MLSFTYLLTYLLSYLTATRAAGAAAECEGEGDPRGIARVSFAIVSFAIVSVREIREVDAAYPPTHLPTYLPHQLAPAQLPQLPQLYLTCPTSPPTQVDAAEAGGRRSGLASRTLPRGALRHFEFTDAGPNPNPSSSPNPNPSPNPSPNPNILGLTRSSSFRCVTS